MEPESVVKPPSKEPTEGEKALKKNHDKRIDFMTKILTISCGALMIVISILNFIKLPSDDVRGWIMSIHFM